MTEGIRERAATAATALRHKLLLRTRAQRWALRTREEWLGLRPVYEAAVDMRYGGWCGGSEPSATRGANPVRSVHYNIIARVFREAGVRVSPEDVLVDVGCGKGRVINWWLSQGWRNPMVGLELVEAVAERARARLAGFPNVRVIAGDALENLPADGTIFYMYNPFDGPRVRTMAERLADGTRDPRRLRVIYLNPCHLDDFLATGPWHARIVPSGGAEPAAILALGSAKS
jgi:SAM-dependent methyltransferase